jgi:hypothetical protein
MNAVDQPQVLDDREFHLVPDEIKRVDVSYYDIISFTFLFDLQQIYLISGSVNR